MLLIVCMILSCIPAVTVAAAGVTTIQDLEVDQRTNPMGIDNTTPEFRWEMVSDVQGQKQTAYQIVVKDGEETVWDSGKVESDISNGIAYEGSALESSTRYTWNVTVWDKDGKELTSSEQPWFEMGLLNQKEDWSGAHFIAPSDGSAEKNLKTTSYTIDFDFNIVQDNAGLAFGMKDSGTFIMWQVSSFEGKADGQVLLRPHFKKNGFWVGYPGQAGYTVKAADITAAVGYAPTEIAGKSIHQRIVVDNGNIKTYFCASGDRNTPTEDMILANDYTYNEAWPFYGIGFRQSNDGAGNSQEIAKFDNIVAVDNTTGEVLCSYDFEDGKACFAAGNGTSKVVDGWLQVGNSANVSEQVYTKTAGDGSNAPMFRKDFTVKEGLVSARLYATSLGIYEAYINGSKVGDQKMAPGWTNYHDYIQYQAYDVTNMLSEGSNAMGAIVGNGWYSGHVSTNGGVNKYGVDEAFIGQLVLTYADGSVEKIGTDATWQSYLNGPYVDTCNQNGETYDARLEVPGWANANFDASEWQATKVATIKNIDTEVDTENVALVAQPEDPVRVIEEMPVKFLAKTGEDTYVYDIGQNISGMLRIKVKGEAGTTLKLRHGEMVYEDTNVLYTANLREAKATDYYTLKGDENGEVYEPAFTFHGFRYFEVSGLGYQPADEDITALVVHSQLDRTGWIETSNDLVNQLFSNVVWGQRDNYLSIATDCPQRDERLGWTGDATTFSRTGSLNFDINAFYTKFIRDVENARNKSNGAIFNIAPREGHPVGEGDHGWGDFAVVGPWTMFTAYGDKAILEENWQMMTEWINYCLVHKAGDDLLCAADAYGDWLAVKTSPGNVTATSYFAYSTSLMVKMAEALGKTEDVAYYTSLFNRIRTAYLNAYVNKTTGAITGDTQTIYAMALYFDLIEDDALRVKVGEQLVKKIEEANWHLTTGFLGCEILLPALTEAGYSEIAYQLLLNTTYPSWLYPVVNGATTIWERWNSYIAETGTFGEVGMNSFNHYSYGSVAEWLYQYAAGIQYDEANPGYKHFTIAPHPSNQLPEFKAEYESIYGRIVSDWVMDGETFTLNVTIPANTSATVKVPAAEGASLTLNGAAATGYTTEGTCAVFEMESGSYTFVSTVKGSVSVKAGTDDSTTGKTLVNMTINGESGGFANVTVGSEVTVEAASINPAEWEFVSWSGAVESTENPVTITANENVELLASFRYIGKNNLALGKTVTVNTNDGGAPTWAAANLTDGLYINTSSKNGWTSAGVKKDACDVTVTIDLGASQSMDRVQLYPRADAMAASGKPAAFPKNFTISVSDDNKTWTTVATVTDSEIPDAGIPYVVDFDLTSGRYVKFNATKTHDMATDDTVDRVQLAEFGIYNTSELASEYDVTIDGNGQVKVNGEVVTLPFTGKFAAKSEVTVEAVATATSMFQGWTGSVNSTDPVQKLYMVENKTLTATFGSPATVNHALKAPITANTNLPVAGAWGIEFLNDGNTVMGTGYSNNNDVSKVEGQTSAALDVKIDLDLGETTLMDKVVIYPRSTPAEKTPDGKLPSYPRDFTLQVSNDGVNWTIVHTVVDSRTPEWQNVNGAEVAETMYYELEAPAVGRYFRLHATESGLLEKSDVFYRVQLRELEIYNENYIESVAFTSSDKLDLNRDLSRAAAGVATELTATLADGQTLVLTGLGLETTYTSSNEDVATVDANGNVTTLSAGTTELTAEVTVNGITYTAKQTVTVGKNLLPVALSVAGADSVTILDEEVSFTVSAEDMVDTANFIVRMAVDTETMTDVVAEGNDDWMVILQSYENGVLTVALGSTKKNGATSDEAQALMTVTAKTTGKPGNATVSILETSEATAYLDDGTECFVELALGEDASVTTEVKFNPYDVNRDGVVNLLDITRAQRCYGEDSTGPNWNEDADVNGDDMVNINDLILILNNYTK